MWWMRVYAIEWMNYLLFFYVMNVTSKWMYEWYERLCDWGLFQDFISVFSTVWLINQINWLII